MIIELPFAAAALLAAGIAAVTDVRSRKIYNWLTLPLLVGAPFLHLANAGWAGFGASLMGVFLVLVLLCALHFVAGRGLGGGDLKLLIALGALVGAPLAPWLVLYSAVSGFLLAIPVMLLRRSSRVTFQNMLLRLVHRQAGEQAGSFSSGPRLPYALCILVGTAVACFWGPLG